MTVILVLAGVGAVAAAAFLFTRTQRERPAPASKGGGRRILFPFTGSKLSESALDAAIRLARAEDATLVPAYLAEVPLALPLASALPRRCESALPILEAIEQRAQRQGVEVEPRIERGRTNRHALAELIEHEPYDRIVAPAETRTSEGFSADDVAWLLDHAGGEIVVFRSDDPRPEEAFSPEPLAAAG